MRILYYNWVDYLQGEKRGGGVALYQRHLMQGWAEADDVDAWFLSAGMSYDPLSSRPRWAAAPRGPGEDRTRRFEIVNSGTLATSHQSFGAPEQLSHPETVAAFADFLRTHGPFDAIHFNNLEGLPAEVLALKPQFPATRFILSLHNYYPFCPQVNLWFQDRAHCEDFAAGENCTVCLPYRYAPGIMRSAGALTFVLKKVGVRPGTRLFDGVVWPVMRWGGRGLRRLGRLRRGRADGSRDATAGTAPGGTPPRRFGHGADFAARRVRFVQLINAHCDRVLCVSERVRVLAEQYGLDPALLRTLYIGTPHAARFAATRPRPSILRPDGTLGLGYLGYMRRDKGFHFLLDALEALPGALAGRLHLLVAAAATDRPAMARLQRLGDRLDSVRHVDGYDHGSLDALLAEVDVGLVPVMWEDNLPQVAIEMHARHIPLLVSDRGGARELSGCDAMVFRAGDTGDFADRIAVLLGGEVTAQAYWAGPVRAPVSMPAHLEALRAVYAGRDGPAERGAQDRGAAQRL